MGRLIRSNLESLQLAKELLSAQESSDAQAVRAGMTIDAAAASNADRQAIETAVRAVAEAGEASAQEADAATAWSMHRLAVYELVTSAVQLLGSMPDGGYEARSVRELS